MTSRFLTGTLAASSLLIAASAHAHEGEHGAVVLANILHWLSSPTHSLFAVIAGVTVSTILFRIARKRRA